MKTILLYSAACLITGFAFGQQLKESDVPMVVRQAFAKNFPKAGNVKWSKESATEFEAEFKSGTTEQSVNFDPSGKWLETETEIKNSELPAPVLAAIGKMYADFKIEEAEKTESADRPLLYEVELKKNKATLEVQFSADGREIHKKEKKEKD